MPTPLSLLTPPPRRKRRFVREAPSPFQLTARDIELVHHVARHRFLRSTHLSELVVAPHKKVCDRLTGLFHAGFLDRPRAQLERYREGGGSAPMVYALGPEGARLLIEHFGSDVADVDWRRKNELAGRQFILHTLAIADVRVALTRAVRKRPGFAILEPADLLALAPPEACRPERPWIWRVPVRYGDATHDLGVAPDHVFAVRYPDGPFRAYLVECDRGTMPVDRPGLAQTSLKRKVLAYTALKRVGLLQRQLGWKAFRVLVVTNTRQRADNLLATITETVHEQGRGLFLVADRAALEPSDIFDFAWRDATGATHSLV
ncbi:MAG: replication-relaxation family protein [Hyphomicrobiaceae bacterium]